MMISAAAPGASMQDTWLKGFEGTWVAGPPSRIETRYLESADLMVTELANVSGGPAFNRTVLRRKAK